MLAITYVLAVLALVASALGRVYNMTAPATGAQGSNITAVLYSESYIQNWDDFGVSRSAPTQPTPLSPLSLS